jgi:FkbM family methyltransferase
MSRLLHLRVPLLVVLPILVVAFFFVWPPPTSVLRSCRQEVPAVVHSPAVEHLPKVLEYFKFDPKNPQKFLFPEGTKSIVIDIGQHVSPILPKSSSEFVIGFEAILERYKDNVAKNRHVANKLFIPMAVGKEDGMLMFKELAASEASSLLDVNEDAISDRLKVLKENNYDAGKDPFEIKYKYFLPVTALKHVIERIPDHITLSFLKIDTQGNEMQVLQGAGPLKRFQSIMAEVTVKKQFYKDSASEAEMLTFMRNAGFELDHADDNSFGEEKNLYFRPIK